MAGQATIAPRRRALLHIELSKRDHGGEAMTASSNKPPKSKFSLTEALRAHFHARETATHILDAEDRDAAAWATNYAGASDDAIRG